VESHTYSAAVIAVCTGGVWAKHELMYMVDTYPELQRAAADEEIRCAVTLWAAAYPRLSFQHV